MVKRLGFSNALGPVAYSSDPESTVSPVTLSTIESEVRTLIEQAQQRAKDLLTEKKVELDRLAKALVEHETLDLREVRLVISGEKIVKDDLDKL